MSLTGGLAIGVPGELKGLWELHQRFGSLPWKDLLEPTIKLCRDGAVMTRSLHDAAAEKESVIGNDPEYRYRQR